MVKYYHFYTHSLHLSVWPNHKRNIEKHLLLLRHQFIGSHLSLMTLTNSGNRIYNKSHLDEQGSGFDTAACQCCPKMSPLSLPYSDTCTQACLVFYRFYFSTLSLHIYLFSLKVTCMLFVLVTPKDERQRAQQLKAPHAGFKGYRRTLF